MNYWIWFSTINLLSIRDKLNLLKTFKSPEKIYYTTKKELLLVNGINETKCNIISTSKDKNLIVNMENYMKKNNINLVNITDDNYPFNLKNIYDPPITLFYKGNTGILNKNKIAVIGTRAPSYYGAYTSYKIANELSDNNICIVSGLAKGIDSKAHEGALNSIGKTIAVIGNGLDYIYPLENKTLYENISHEGLLISEYPVGMKPLSKNFPARNRIISGISDGVIVVEAKSKSGALITVDFALEQGKNVYAIPGNINSPNSTGTNDLLRDGAILYRTIKDL